MNLPYADLTDLLALNATSFQIIDDGGPNESGSFDNAVNGSGQFQQADIAQTELKYTHKYNVKLLASAAIGHADRPRVGKHTGLSGEIYIIDSVDFADKTKHPSLSVSFHRFADVAASISTIERTDIGLT